MLKFKTKLSLAETNAHTGRGPFVIPPLPTLEAGVEKPQ